MQPKKFRLFTLGFITLLIAALACNMPGAAATPVPPTSTQVVLVDQPAASQPATQEPAPAETMTATTTVQVTHVLTPSAPRGGKLVYDVESAGTAPEKRAPYGDSYDLNRLERPFTQDMTYIADLDIASFTVAKDNDWWYVSMDLVGADPNNAVNIHYGIELDLDRDGFGDFLIWAQPPYTPEWATLPVKVYQDSSHNTSGLSATKSDAPFSADGYETLIFDGSVGGNDPDLAWVRINAGEKATVQFAFKRSWSGSVFMLGVLADAGLKDPGKLDYVDRFQIAEAGSPVRDNAYYPLGALFSVDNTCRDAFGFEPTRYEPQICPIEPTPTKAPSEPQAPGPTPVSCVAVPCPPNQQWNANLCRCLLIPPD